MAKRKKEEDLLGMEIPAESDEAAEELPPGPDAGAGGPDLLGDMLPPPPPSTPPVEGYVVLARRYRPQTFAEIVGQEQVQKSLCGAITTGQIPHSFLFSGPRGTGKTSTARILAKALNCQDGGPRPDPCGKCDSCRAITAGSSLDVIEIDAASNTGVDNIRDLRTGVVLAPFSRYKVYIIDEVHMLSMAAFNALLKTLEEPPSQVVFVLATTELQKVPETIVSRCQCFGFRRFTVPEIAGQLDRIMGLEMSRRKLEVPDEDRRKIVELLARSAEGGMRDAQVSLDQVLVLSQGKIDFDAVRRFLGIVECDILDDFVRAIHERRTHDGLMLIEQLVAEGQDLERFVKALVEQMRDLLIVRTAPDKPGLVNCSTDRYAAMRELAATLPVAFLLNASSTLLRTADEMKTSSQARFVLELALIRLTRVDAVEDIGKIVARLQEIEKALAGGARPAAPAAPAPAQAPPPPPPPSPPPAAPRASAPPQARPAPPPAPPRKPEDEGKFLAQAPQLPPATQTAAQPAPLAPGQMQQLLRQRTLSRSHHLHMALLETHVDNPAGSQLLLRVRRDDKFTHDLLGRPQNLELIREIAREACGCDITVRIEKCDALPEAECEPVPALPDVQTIAAPAEPAMPDTADSLAEDTVAEDPPADLAAAPTAEPAEERVIRYSPEIIERATRKTTGAALKRFMENRPDIQDVFAKISEVFKVDESSVTLRTRTL